MKSVSSRLQKLLFKRHRFFGRLEYKLLQSMLRPGEFIKHSIWGMYQGGSGILAQTNQRVFLIDRRPFFDYVQQNSFDQISYAGFRNGFMAGILSLKINDITVEFHSLSDARLKVMQEDIVSEIDSNRLTLPYDLRHEKIVKPLYKRVKRHPAWVPHNPVMMKILESAGAQKSTTIGT